MPATTRSSTWAEPAAMKIIKPTKLPVLHRVVEIRRRPYFHIAGILAFPLASPRALLDEMAFWQASASALGERGVFDDGFAKARGELLVCGSFFAPQGKPVTASFVRARLGGIDKRLAVVGNRTWRNQVPTEPEPFTTMPIDWAHAFGGAGFDRNPLRQGRRARRRGRAAGPRAAQCRILRADDSVAERAARTRGVHVDGCHLRAAAGSRGDVRQALSRGALPRDARRTWRRRSSTWRPRISGRRASSSGMKTSSSRTCTPNSRRSKAASRAFERASSSRRRPRTATASGRSRCGVTPCGSSPRPGSERWCSMGRWRSPTMTRRTSCTWSPRAKILPIPAPSSTTRTPSPCGSTRTRALFGICRTVT
jgi:hypothetical protein